MSVQNQFAGPPLSYQNDRCASGEGRVVFSNSPSSDHTTISAQLHLEPASGNPLAHSLAPTSSNSLPEDNRVHAYVSTNTPFPQRTIDDVSISGSEVNDLFGMYGSALSRPTMAD